MRTWPPRRVLYFRRALWRRRRALPAAGLALALLAAGLAGCRRGAPRGNWSLTLSTVPAVPAAGQSTRFVLHVVRAGGRPLSGASAQLSLKMTSMDMGANVVQLAPQGGGNYAGSGQFTMSGDWDCQAAVEAGGVTRQRTFHYKVE